MLEKLSECLNKGYSVETETFIQKTFYYLFQVAIIIPNFRNLKWIILSSIHVLHCFSNTIYISIAMIIGGYHLKTYQMGLMAQGFHIAGVEILSLCNGLSCMLNRKYFIDFFTTAHNNFYNYSKTQIDKKIQQYWIKELYNYNTMLFKLLLVYSIMVGWTSGIGIPLLDQLQGFENKQSHINGIYMDIMFPIWLPVDIHGYYEYYIAMTLEGFAILIVMIQSGAGVLAKLFQIHCLITQLRILINSIKNIEQRAVERCNRKYRDAFGNLNHIPLYENTKFLKEYESCLKENIQHHQIIIRYTNYVEICWRWGMFATICIVSLVMACAMVTVLQGDKRLSPQVMSGILLTAELISIAFICWKGQELLDQGDELSKTLYDINWINTPKNIKMNLIIMQEVCKKPLVLKAGGFIPVNLELLANIINSAYSYFNLLFALK